MRLRLVLGACAALVFASSANAGLVVDKRLGNNSEGATTITNGRYANNVAILDGYDVIAVPTEGNGKARAQKLFDVKTIPWVSFPSGIAYIPSERSFVFDDQGDLTDLQVVSEAGAVQAPRPITFLPDYPAEAIGAAEGLAYLPQASPWPDAIARAVWFPDDLNPAHIEVLSRDGVVLKEIGVSLPPEEAYITGLAYLGKDGFLVTTADNNMWHVALDGSVTGPVNVPDATGIEGLATLPDGRVYAADYTLGRLLAFDKNLRRDLGRDRSYEIGVGLSRAFDGFWDTSTGAWALLGLDRDHIQTTIALVSASLGARTLLFHLPGFFSGLAAGPGGTVATCPFDAPGIGVYSRSGSLVSTIDFTTVVGMPARRCQTIAYLPSLDAYAVKVVRRANRQRVFVVSTSGVLLRTLVVPSPISALTSPPEASSTVGVWQPFIGTYETYDASTGALLSAASIGLAPLLQPAGFIAGPNGSYALLDGNDSEMAVFSG